MCTSYFSFVRVISHVYELFLVRTTSISSVRLISHSYELFLVRTRIFLVRTSHFSCVLWKGKGVIIQHVLWYLHCGHPIVHCDDPIMHCGLPFVHYDNPIMHCGHAIVHYANAIMHYGHSIMHHCIVLCLIMIPEAPPGW